MLDLSDQDKEQSLEPSIQDVLSEAQLDLVPLMEIKEAVEPKAIGYILLLQDSSDSDCEDPLVCLVAIKDGPPLYESYERSNFTAQWAVTRLLYPDEQYHEGVIDVRPIEFTGEAIEALNGEDISLLPEEIKELIEKSTQIFPVGIGTNIVNILEMENPQLKERIVYIVPRIADLGMLETFLLDSNISYVPSPDTETIRFNKKEWIDALSSVGSDNARQIALLRDILKEQLTLHNGSFATSTYDKLLTGIKVNTSKEDAKTLEEFRYKFDSDAIWNLDEYLELALLAVLSVDEERRSKYTRMFVERKDGEPSDEDIYESLFILEALRLLIISDLRNAANEVGLKNFLSSIKEHKHLIQIRILTENS